MMRIIIALALAVSLGACASITGSSNQPVSVTTTADTGQVQGANCNLVNSKGSWYVVTPGSVVVHKAFGDLAITCKKDALAGTATFQSSADAGVYGNIVFGGLIGYGIDAGSGAGFSYPPTMNVPINAGGTPPVTGAAQPPMASAPPTTTSPAAQAPVPIATAPPAVVPAAATASEQPGYMNQPDKCVLNCNTPGQRPLN